MLWRLFFCVSVLGACSRPIAQARMSTAEPASAPELDARQRVSQKRCSGNWAYMPLILGLGQFCHHKDEAAATLALLGSAELSTGILVGQHSEQGFEGSGSVLALTAYQDSWLIGITDMLIDRDLSKGLLYAPADSLADLALAPFNLEVMKRPKVWAGLLAALAVGVSASLALDGGLPESSASDDANLFGRQVPPAVGYPGAMAAFGGLFSHVAPAEELLFRGVIQSELSRRYGETFGLVSGSLVFGAAHAPNALALPEEDRRDYLVYGLPVITALGSYLGYLYQDSGYSLAPPTALHFWYDFLLSATFFTLDPQNSPLSASLKLPF